MTQQPNSPDPIIDPVAERRGMLLNNRMDRIPPEQPQPDPAVALLNQLDDTKIMEAVDLILNPQMDLNHARRELATMVLALWTGLQTGKNLFQREE